MTNAMPTITGPGWLRSVGGALAPILAALSLYSAQPAVAGSDAAILTLKGRGAPAAAMPDAARRAAESATDSARERWHEVPLAALAQGSFRWLASIPPGVTPFEDLDGVNCGVHQEGRFWYLGAPLNATRSCVVPAGRAIVAPLFVSVNDYPCPDPNFKPAPGQSLEEFLRTGIAPLVDSVSQTQALLDGKPLRVRRVTTGVISFAGAKGLDALDPCITGSPQSALVDGYFALIDPPAPGDHVLVLRSTSVLGASEATYMLKVR